MGTGGWREDTIEVAVLDEHEGDFLVDEDGRHGALFLVIHHQRKKLVDHSHVHVPAIVSRDQRLTVCVRKRRHIERCC